MRRQFTACLGCALVLGLAASAACKGQTRGQPHPPADPEPASAAPAPPPDEPMPGSARTRTGFRVPTALERHRAVGAGAVLSPRVERAVYIHDSFEPMTEPEPGDWLAEHPESGQTFARFVASRPNRPTADRSTVYFLPIGDFDPRRSPPMAMLREYAGAFFSMPVRVLPAVRVDDVGATTRTNELTGKKQLLTSDILAYLKKRLPGDAYCLIGLTQVDLYPEPSWNFVFGQASLRERVGVHSFARYHPAFHGGDDAQARDTDRTLVLRSLKVLVHELGHMFGIEHCIYFQCVINGSNSMAETDRQPLHLCPVELRKLIHSVGFDPLARYRALRAFYRKHGLSDQARWVEGRIKEIAEE